MSALHPQIKLNGTYWRRVAGEQCMKAPQGWVCIIKPPTRTLDQNRRLHAMLSAIEKSGFEWDGEKRDVEQLKVLFISAWRIATHQPSEVVKGFAGEVVQLRKSTTTMTVEELGELMDYIEFWCADHEPPINLGKSDGPEASALGEARSEF